MPLLLLAYLAFASIALPDGLLGVAWPSMRVSLGEPVSALGWLLPFGVVSSLLSSASTGFIVTRTGVGRLLAASTALSAVALVGYSLAPAFWMIIAATVLLAAGSGAIDSGLNTYAARHFNARYINWMHASYGLGATIGPLLVTATISAGLSWRWAYSSVAAVQAVIAVAFVRTSRAWATNIASDRTLSTRKVATIGGSSRHILRVGAVWGGAGIFALQTGLESSTTLWAFLFLTDGRGLAAGPAALTVSAYWATLCIGRLVLGPVADRFGSRRVLTGGVTGITLSAVLVVLPAPTAVAVAGIILIGLSAAPMFPLLTLTTRERVGSEYADRAIGLQVAASSVGAATIPAIVGVVIGHFGTRAFGPCLLIVTLATSAAYVRSTRVRYGVPLPETH
jgi:fucose permease